MKRTWLVALPLVIFVAVIVFLYQGLSADPRARDSQILNQPLPEFSLPDLMHEERQYTPADLQGEVTILNVWGVWCVTCAVELPYLTYLADNERVKFVGLYFDQDIDPDFGGKTITAVRKEVQTMLSQYGNPYAFNIYDVYRDMSLDLGVTGAPEHFVIDQHGVIRMHHIGDINERVWTTKVGPMYHQLVKENTP